MSQAITPVKPTILVVPLDWGLGHATRCVPVIRALLQQNCSVILAGEDKTKNLLQKEFPQLIFLPLQGYRITYAKNRKGLLPALMMQLPKIRAAIRKEGDWLRRMVDAYGIQGVISDNRYGLYHPGIPTVLITHQLLIKTSLGNRLDAWLQQIHYRWISRFSECWVPDQA
ncbi:MAG: glycosyltransferase, partial [Flavisolibacter sp.]